MDTITVNNLFWQTKNLAKTTYKNGNEINFAKNKIEFEKFNNLKIPCYHWKDFDSNNSYLGCCYNEFALKNMNEIAEDDFRLPTLLEWKDLLRITGYLFVEDDSHLWESPREYFENRQKNNIKSLKVLKKRGEWKKGNHSGNDKLGFQALPHENGTYSSWAYLSTSDLTLGAFSIGSTPDFKKIEAEAFDYLTSGLVRLVKNKNESISEKYIEIGGKFWATENFNHLDFKMTEIPQLADEKEWEEQTNLQKPASCYHNNNPDNEYMLYNYFACESISKQLPEGYRIASLADFESLIKNTTNQDKDGLLSLLDITCWKNFYSLDYKKVKSKGLNIKPTGIREALFVIIMEGESLYSYRHFSGKKSYATFWTSDGHIVKFELEDGKVKYEIHKVENHYDGPEVFTFFSEVEVVKYCSGQGLSIRLIKE